MGVGYDAHRFAKSRSLILGGVRIDGAVGLSGRSDADALLHAIGDGLLGAAGAGDLGAWFPESATPEGMSSLEILRKIGAVLFKRGYSVENIDAVIIAEAPRLSPYLPSMREAIAKSLNSDIARINVKVTGNDRMGFIGRSEGIGAVAVCLLVGSKEDV